jgi:DNA primase
VARRDPEALQAAVRDARPFLAFRVDRVLNGADLRSAEGRSRAAESALAVIREHPKDLVREQYMMEVADRCRFDLDQLRAAMAAGPSGRVRMPSAPARPRQVDGPEVEALRLAVHHPEDVAGRLHEVLFSDELYAAAFRALASATTLHDAVESADPEAGALLRRLAVEESTAEADDVVQRMTREATNRAIASLRPVRASGEPNLDVGWLKLMVERLEDPSATNDAATQLVAWLVKSAEEQQA